MSYGKWYQTHGRKHNAIIAKLREKGLDQEEIIVYFEYDQLAKTQPHFCPLFAQHKKCHDVSYLNCYFCGCPFFCFSSNPEAVIQSSCAVNSRFGVQKSYKNKLYLDCTDCHIPHTYQFVRKNFTYNWFDAMKMCKKETKD